MQENMHVAINLTICNYANPFGGVYLTKNSDLLRINRMGENEEFYSWCEP